MEARSQLRHRPTLEGYSYCLLPYKFRQTRARVVFFATKKGSVASGLKICLLSLARRYLVARIAVLLAASQVMHAQQPVPAAPAAPAPATIPSSAIVQPALTEVQRSVSALNIPRWKAPGQVKSAAQQDTGSIQRDLSDTLPGLLSKADAAPTTVPPAFVVFRNIDALYDVLLRVSQTASLAAPQGESDALFSSLNKLEAARSQLGDAILSASQQREAQVVKLEDCGARRCGCAGSGAATKDHGDRRWSRPTYVREEKEEARCQTPGEHASRRSNRLNVLKYTVFRETILRQPVSKKDRVSETLGRRRQSCSCPLAGCAFCLLL